MRKYFVESKTQQKTGAENEPMTEQTLTLDAIYVYPIKSCARFPVSQWEITSHGRVLSN